MALAEQVSFPRAGAAMAALPEALRKGTLHPVVKIYLVLILIPFSFDLGPLNMTGIRTLLILMVVPMAFRLFTGKCGKLHAADFLFLGHLLWIILTLAINNPRLFVQNVGATGVEFLGGYLLGRNFIRSREDMIGLFRFATVLVILTLPLALIETKTGNPLILKLLDALPIVNGNPQAPSSKRMGLERVQMGYLTPIHYGLYCTLAFSFCFVGLRQVYSRLRRQISTALIGVCIFLSLSSGALLPMVLQMFLIGWDWTFRNVARRWLLLLGCFAFIYVTIDLLSNRTPYKVFISYATFSPGTAYWRDSIAQFGMKNVWANPIFGIGLNNWVRPAWMYTSSVDNFWLLMAMRHGIPGFVLVAAGYLAALVSMMRKDLRCDSMLQDIRLAWVFCFAALAFTLTSVHIWSEIYSYTFFLIGAGLWVLEAEPKAEGVATAEPAGPRGRAPQRRTLGQAMPERPAAVFARNHAAQAMSPTPAESEVRPPPEPPRYTRFPHQPKADRKS